MKSASKPPAAVHRSAHEVRIVGGQWKRSKLAVVDRPGLRPTPDRVRETLFNWLQHLSGGSFEAWRCVDAFAGTGALGLEAASRGAQQVTLFEQETALVALLQRTLTRLGATTVRVQRGDGLAGLLRLPAGSVDLVFLDPPFDADVFDRALAAAAHAVATNGFIYLEAPTPWQDDVLARWGLHVCRYFKAGSVHAHLLERDNPQQPPQN